FSLPPFINNNFENRRGTIYRAPATESHLRHTGLTRFMLSSRIEKHERADKSTNFRASVFHPGRAGWEVRAEAREVRGRKNARHRRRNEDRGHAKSRGAGGAGDWRRTPRP